MTEIKQDIKTDDTEMRALYKAYQKLQKSIEQWQVERGEYWAQTLIPNGSSPYFSLSSLPEGPVLELVRWLLEGTERHWSEKELRPFWSRFLLGQGLEDPELFSRLNLAVNGVLGLARKLLPESLRQAAEKAEAHFCPVCGQEAGLAVLVPPVGKRYLHCTGCGHEWPGKRVGCIHCGSEEASEQTYLNNEDFPGVELVVCQTCGGSFKEVDLRERTVDDLVWEDIRTLPLNFAAEKWFGEQAQKKGSLQ